MYTLESGEKREEVTYVDVVLWSRLAEIAGEYLKKGRPVFIEGRLQLDTWDDKQSGQKRSKLRVIGETMQLLGGRPAGAAVGGERGGVANRVRAKTAPPPKPPPRPNRTRTRFRFEFAILSRFSGLFKRRGLDRRCTGASTIMNSTEACIALNMLPTVGPVRLRKLLEVFKQPEQILAAKRERAAPGRRNRQAKSPIKSRIGNRLSIFRRS